MKIRNNIFKLASMMLGLWMMGTTQGAAQSATTHIYYVTAEAKADADNSGADWDNAMTLQQALDSAKAGDEVRVKGYQRLTTDKLYITPDADSGFKLKSGVSLRGGYTGEKDAGGNDVRSPKNAQRYNYTYQSALVGDVKSNDKVESDLLIFPDNETRDDNAVHVLQVDLGVDDDNPNANNQPTVVEGFTIAGGHASGAKNSEDGQGGGIYVTNNSWDDNVAQRKYEISECFFVNNYGTQGGGIYVDPTVTNDKSMIEYCGFFNNVSGTRSGNENFGGGIYLSGAGIIHNCAVLNNVNGGIRFSGKAKVVNCTIVHNTVSGVDFDANRVSGAQPKNGYGTLYNTVIWGNSTLCKLSPSPLFDHCAYPEVAAAGYGKTDANGNVKISPNNFSSDASTWFVTPSSQLGYDQSFDAMNSMMPTYSLELEEQSALLAAGSLQNYKNIMGETSYTLDLANEPRYQTSTIDIGAFERERLGTGRRLFVKQGGKGDGSSWSNAMGDVQQAINKLADGTGKKGEVWVAAGTYYPTTRIGASTANNVSLSFQMKDGISVYGGFAGTESHLADRERIGKDKFWKYKNETILQGETNNGAAIQPNWNSSEEAWRVSSKSTHVVWFAPDPANDKSDFKQSTILEGFTIQGGNTEGNSELAIYHSDRGAGVYMASINAVLRRCIVRYNYAGMSKKDAQGDNARGGGVYCQGGQVRYCLIYNNSASEGGGIYLEDAGFINNSMISNNSAQNGGGVYLKKNSAYVPDNYLILSTNIISNNTNTQNGAVYVASPAIVEQNTIVNNYTSNVTDATITNSSHTGGLYITESCTAVNNILWNNTLGAKDQVTSSSSLAQIYTSNGTKDKVRFYNNAISDVNSTTWNNMYQTGTYELSSSYLGQIFAKSTSTSQYPTAESFNTTRGVQYYWDDIEYLWPLCKGSVIRSKGLLYAQLPMSLLFKPCTDFLERNFESRPPIGAYVAEAPKIVFDKSQYSTGKQCYRLHYSQSNPSPDGDGSAWDKEYTSINEMFDYLTTLNYGDEITVASGTDTQNVALKEGDYVEITLRAGTYEASTPYTFQENEAKAKTLNVKPTIFPVYILGGYPSWEAKQIPEESDRNPSENRTEITGNAKGSDLSDGLFHVVRIEAGSHITIDGISLTKGYASGRAYVARGGAVLIGSVNGGTTEATQVKLSNCIIENNTASTGAAIASTEDAKNIQLELVNCVINNNSSIESSKKVNSNNLTAGADLKTAHEIIDLGDDNNGNKMTLRHITFVNNIGIMPSNLGNTSFAAGNRTYNYASQELTSEGANNTPSLINLATTDAAGAVNFANPTKAVGAYINANVYLGGNAEFRPLTSSKDNDAIINQAADDKTLSFDINGEERDLGGAADLGAYEAILPKAGRVIYVRSYNQDWTQTDETEGNPDFNLLVENPNNVYDGTTWSRAIMGNAICKFSAIKDEAKDNDFYAFKNTGSKVLSAATYENSDYNGDYPSAQFGQQSNAYSQFFISGSVTSGTKDNGNRRNQTMADGKTKYNQITNNRDEEYISGLQYAVEKAAVWNKEHPDDPMEVWVGAGVYTDWKGFVIRNGVKVYGGFPKDGNPGESDRRPLLSQYIPARKQYADLDKADYETILQVRKESPIYMTQSSKELWWQEGKPSDGSDHDFIQKAILNKVCQRHHVLYQPDVCLPTWAPINEDKGYIGADQYRWPGSGMGYDDNTYYQEYKNVTWDGFSIRHGYLTNYPANRDGGAGVRVFRGINLENLIIVNNLDHGLRTRGGGLFMDGMNSTIKNSYLLRNMTAASAPGTPYSAKGQDTYYDNINNKDSYGGGAYMLTGVGYNMVVASNRVYSGDGATGRGGGIFIENAIFYNNTVAYNQAKEGAGIMHWQGEATGIKSALTLYNCLLFENFGDSGNSTNQVDSKSSSSFKATHCFIGGNISSSLISNGTDGNIVVQVNNEKYNPFEANISIGDKTRKWSEARLTNNYRLNENSTNSCLNNGTEDLPNMPSTDMDYTNRIKDCAIDIGAYEADNTANIKPQEKKNAQGITDYVYYVTQNGWGNRSGDSPANAACADKLQSILTAAGEKFKEVNQGLKLGAENNHQDDAKASKVYVKVAGYEPDDNGVRFVYHANTLADPDDPRSYTFVIPNGVWLMGGYYEGAKNATGTLAGYNWDTDKRDVMSNYQTILSAKTEPKLGSAVEQVVNGYHTVTFGYWPKGADTKEYNQNAVKYRAVVDGIHLIDGDATDNAGFKALGGAAIVPMNAHVRNCVMESNKALKGGALCLLPGGMVSGSLLHDNEGNQGGAIYAESYDSGQGTTLNYHAYAVSCTIADNTATEGGGIYQELGSLMAANLVVWGNTATTDKNISGVVDQKFPDQVLGEASTEGYYPYNDCFVERYLLPANTRNEEMTNDLERYFVSNGEFRPRPYSSLIDQGVTTEYYNRWIQTAGVLSYDILGHDRRTATGARLTAGAYGMSTLTRDPKQLLTRLFVSAGGGANVSDAVRQKYLGRSFYTPFNSLDAALDYIRQVRSTKKNATSDETVADSKTKFEILMTGGTYRPTTMRDGNNVSAADPTDRRLNSFVIPENVSIYGGFKDTDPYSSNLKNVRGTDKDDLTSITESDGTVIVSNLTTDDNAEGTISAVLNYRNTETSHMTDQNKNGLIEPWEFSNQTILSGDIKASAKEKKVYHVVFSRIPNSDESSAERSNDVLLDGITIMNGETKDDIEYVTGENGYETEEENLNSDVGHGGGIYSENVSYTLNRCRIVSNIAVHGGGIYVKDGSLDIINSVIGGNWAGSESGSMGIGAGHGGGVCLYLTKSDRGNFHAVNSLFVNNEAISAGRSRSMGGAIYVRRADDLLTYQQAHPTYRDVSIMNCIVAQNASEEDAAIRLIRTDKDAKTIEAPTAIYNTVLWNNKDNYNYLSGADMEYSASDQLEAHPLSKADHHNVQLDTLNMTATGPRFVDPTTVAGKNGFNMLAKWNPAAISVLTDAGNGVLAADNSDLRQATGEYHAWWELHNPRLYNVKYDSETTNYITKARDEQSRDTYYYGRYMGPMNDDGSMADKTIDIGLYEFQYQFSFSDNQAVYIGTEGKGKEDGSNWDNRSTDLRGAIIAMAHATGNTADKGNEGWTHRKIYVMGGEYFSPQISGAGDAFTLQVNKDKGNELVSSLEIVGACTGNTLDKDKGEEERNFANPTTLVPNKELEAKNNQPTNILLNITTNGKPVTLSGLTFKNENSAVASTGRIGINAVVNNTSSDQGGKLTLANCGFRNNSSYGASITGNDTGSSKGELLIYNTLFADGGSDGLFIKPDHANLLDATIVNATFAKNQGADITDNGASLQVYNTVSWENGSSIMGAGTTAKVAAETDKDKTPTSEGGKNSNKLFVKGQANGDVMYGPNFADPSKGDYSIRPSRMLLNKGDNSYYMEKVLGKSTWTDADMKGIKDFDHHERFTGKSIDVGASECNSVLQPVIYVKSVAKDGTGASWTSPVNDLMNAISLAGVYANTGQTSPYGYVFVDRGIKQDDVEITLPGVKVYGSMDGTETCNDSITENFSREQIEAVVNKVLSQRKGLIEQSQMSTINGLTLDFAASTHTGNDGKSEEITSVADGFLLTGKNTIKNGYVSTSILPQGASIENPTAEGETSASTATLYNTLALGNVIGNIKSVNVTATTALPTVTGSASNRSQVTELNRYVTDDYWCYQLNDNAADINAAKDNSITKTCTAIVGHNFDIAGNSRIHYKNLEDPEEGTRDDVDNGCFETWNLLQSYKVSAKDYPHGESVVYVTAEDEDEDPLTHAKFHELRLDSTLYTADRPFSPGFLLLKHHAGLRSCGSYVNLTNFAVERNLKANKKDLCTMPFSIVKREYYNDNGTSMMSDQGYITKVYDGLTRAGYDYRFSNDEDQAAWKDYTEAGNTEGVMLTGERDEVLRCYGASYKETSSDKSITLNQYNNNDPWPGQDGTSKFTHKENMGWNLFGSPYLCAMNYKDMEYGRVIYPYDCKEEKYLNPVNTDTDDSEIAGYIPACDAVFTQTATLRNSESFAVRKADELVGTAYQNSNTNVAVQLGNDQLLINAVPAAEAKADFDMGADGVKWMSRKTPQIYAVRDGGRYSLLSAVNIEGSLNIGVSVPEAGNYSLSIPEDCDTHKYETIWLKDNLTGKGVDLLEDKYDFQANEAGEMNSRFVISFNRMAADKNQEVSIYSKSRGRISITGLQTGDHIAIYAASGILVDSQVATATDENLQVNTAGTTIVEVTREGKQVAVKKIAVK